MVPVAEEVNERPNCASVADTTERRDDGDPHVFSRVTECLDQRLDGIRIPDLAERFRGGDADAVVGGSG